MTHEPSRRPLHPLLGAGLISLLALLALAGLKSYRELGAARAREARIEAEIRAAEERRAGLTERIERLRNDPVTIEREVRRSLRWVGPGEVVLVVPEPAGESQATSPLTEAPSLDGSTQG
ncbi:MAG: septum formation initiator family protein [Thermoanaerobaculia bacterium]